LTEIPQRDPLLEVYPTFNVENFTFDYDKIHIDEKYLTTYQTCLDNYFCKICFSLIKNPKSCEKCEELFCSLCLKDCLAKKNECPLCRQKPFKENKISKIVKNTLNDIELFCPLECNQIIKMENFKKHIIECQKRPKFFKCNFCNEKIRFENELANHSINCKGVLRICPYCNESFKYSFIKSHMNTCESSFITCVLCSCVIPKKFKITHYQYYFCEFFSNIKKFITDIINIYLEFKRT